MTVAGADLERRERWLALLRAFGWDGNYAFNVPELEYRAIAYAREAMDAFLATLPPYPKGGRSDEQDRVMAEREARTYDWLQEHGVMGATPDDAGTTPDEALDALLENLLARARQKAAAR